MKSQEELKASRASYRAVRSALDMEKQKLDQREQETFTAQYKLIGTQEALTSTQERLKILEAERDALKTSLKEEEVARVAAEGRIALPIPARRRGGINTKDEDDVEEDEEEGEDDIDLVGGFNTRQGLFMPAGSPTKSPTKRARAAAAAAQATDAEDAEDDGSDKENASAAPPRHNYIKSSSHPNFPLLQSQQQKQQQRKPRHLQHQRSPQSGQLQIDYLRLESEIATERMRRERAEETVEFLKMECQFRCCSCRMAEENELEYVHDRSMAEGMDMVKREAKEAVDIDLDSEVDAVTGGGNDGASEDSVRNASVGDAVAVAKVPDMQSGTVSTSGVKEDYFSLVSAGDDSRMLDKSGITPDEIDGNRGNGVLEEASTGATAALCFSPTSGTFRSTSVASSCAGTGSASTTAAPTADTSFDSDQSNYATPPVSMDRPSGSRVMPFKPLLDTIPSQSASPCHDGVAVQQSDVQNEQKGTLQHVGAEADEVKERQHDEATGPASMLQNEYGNSHKAREDFYTPAEEIDLMDVEDTFCDNNNGKNASNGGSIVRPTEGEPTDEDRSSTPDVPQTPIPRHVMVRTVTTTTQVPLQSTPVAHRDESKVITPHHHRDRLQQYPSTTGPRARAQAESQHLRHHDDQQPPTPMTAPPPSTLTEHDQQQQHHNHHQYPLASKHTPIDREAALAQIQARRGRARSLAEGQQQQQCGAGSGATAGAGTVGSATPRAPGTGMTTPGRSGTTGLAAAAAVAGTGTGSRFMKRDVRDVSAPALRGRPF